MKNFYKVMQASCLVLISFTAWSQVGVGTSSPDASAQLDVTSNSKGVLIPRMTSSERTAIDPAAEGLLVYQTDSPAGFYYRTGSQWVRLLNSGETLRASVPSLFAGNAAGSAVSILLGGTNIPFPSNQKISDSFTVNGGNTVFTAKNAGRYQITYSLKITAPLLAAARIVANGSTVPGSVISPFVAIDKFSTSVVVDLAENTPIQVQLFGLIAIAVLSTVEQQYLSIVKLE